MKDTDYKKVIDTLSKTIGSNVIHFDNIIKELNSIISSSPKPCNYRLHNAVAEAEAALSGIRRTRVDVMGIVGKRPIAEKLDNFGEAF